MNDINYKVVVEELIRLFESDLGEFPILHTAIRCLNQQSQDIETLKNMLSTIDENYNRLETLYQEEKQITENWVDRAGYYLGQYEKVSEQYEKLLGSYNDLKRKYNAKIDANFSLSVLLSAKCDAVKEFDEKLSHVKGDSIPKSVVHRFKELLVHQYENRDFL